MSDSMQPLIYEDPPPTYSTVRDYISVVLRHKRKVVCFIGFVMVCVAVVVSMLEVPYRSEAKLLVRPGWESMNVDPTAATSDSVGGGGATQTVLLNTMLDIIQSRSLAETVVDRIGPARFFDNPSNEEEIDRREIREEAVKILMENTEAQVLHHTQIISISFASPDPELAQNVVRELTELCLLKHKLVYRNPGSYQFLEDQEKEIRTDVERLQKGLTDLKQEMGIISVANRMEFLESNIGLLEQALDETEAERSASEAKIADLQEKRETMPQSHRTAETTSTDYAVINSLREQLYTLRNERQGLISRFTDDSEPVLEKDRQIAEVEAMLSREKPLQIRTETWALNEAYQEVESALRLEETILKSLLAKIQELKKQRVRLEEERKLLIAFEFRYARIEGDLTARESQYESITEKVSQARLEQALEEKRISNISEIQPATLPLEPEKSRKKIILLAGLLAGIVGGIFLAFCADYLDHTLKTPEQVESKLELPALISIPRVNGKSFFLNQ